MTLREAARVLGISKEAVRKRVKRNTLAHEKGEDGRVYVSLPEGDVYIPDGGDEGMDASVDASVDAGGDEGTDDAGGRDHDHPDDRDELISELRAEVAAWREESRRKDHIIAGLIERLPPQLEAPREPREAPEKPPEASKGASPRSGTVGPQTDAQEPEEMARRPWWLRWLGG